MLKSQLAQILSQKTGVPQGAVLEGLQEILDFMTQALKANEVIAIRGFGRFVLREHADRFARNPKTGEKIQIKRHKVPRFSPSKLLIRQLNV